MVAEKHTSYVMELITIKKSFFYSSPMTVFTTLHFLANGPNKLECYIAIGWVGVPGTNTLAFEAHSYVTKKNVVKTAPNMMDLFFSGIS